MLCYHSVHPTRSFASATPALFEEHLQWLGRHCTVLGLREALARRPWPPSGERPVVCLTFDDGYEDNYQYAFPLLRTYGLPATFYLVGGFLEKDPDVLRWLGALRQGSDPFAPLSWAQAREMGDAGMEMEAHSYSHANLAAVPRADWVRELPGTKRLLEKRLGRTVVGLAYPFGKPRRHFNAAVIAAARAAGYRYAVATCSRRVSARDSLFALPRFFVARDSLETLRDKVCGGWDRVGAIQQWTPAWVSRRLSGTDF